MSPRKIVYTDEVKADMRQIIGYYLLSNDLLTSERIIDALYDEIEDLADRHMIGAQMSGRSRPYMYWWVKNKNYIVYFHRTKTTFTVLRIWSSRREPLKPNEIGYV